MKMKAAVLWEPKTDWSVEEVELDPPKAGEVLVKLVGSGLCHSDEHLLTGDLALPEEAQKEMGIQQFPVIGGHEGAGAVRRGRRRASPACKPGDHVVFGFIPSCGKCPSCSTGHQNLCDLGAYLFAGRQVTDFTARHHAKGQDLGLMCCIGTFGEYTVASQASCIKIEDDIPLDKAALVGCGVTTGWGSAVYAADVQPGETVVVVGCGGVGMNAVQGASMAGARHVIAVDPLEFKREQAQIFGATHSAASIEEATALVGDLTWGAMADKVILTMGVAQGEYIQPALGDDEEGRPRRADRRRPVLRRQREHEPVRADDVREAARRLDLRLGQPPPRHPPPAAPLPGGPAEARRAGHERRTRSRTSTSATRPCATAPTSAAWSSTTTRQRQLTPPAAPSA